MLYLLTLHPWVGPSNVALIGQLLGWEPEPAYSEPLLYLYTLPARWVSPERVPWVMNVLAAVLGALNVMVLSRCVALLPHDRTREQRIRGHAEEPLLRGWFAALPVILAAGLLGLQLTYWENATLQSGEMLDLLMFGICVLALLEYRQDLREGWLWASAFIWGAGITNNWAMIGFAPLYVTAVVWIRGWSFFNAAFLTRMILWGLAGLLFYFVAPVFAGLRDAPDLGFWQTLKMNLTLEKVYLLGMPRGRPLLLALVAILPLALVGIRWEGSKGTTIERYATFGGVLLLQILWLAGAVYMAFDPPFSPRRLVYLNESAGSLALLTFSFCSALAAGYFAGWFLLVGFVPAHKAWDRPNPIFAGLGKLTALVVLLACIGVPAGLLIRNSPIIHAQNNGDSHSLARALTQPLPASPVLVVADDPMLARLARAELRTRTGSPLHVFLESRRGPDANYRKWLAHSARNSVPEVAPIATVTENVAGVTTEIVQKLAASGRAYYLQPSFGFFLEHVQALPAGIIFALVPQPAEMAPKVSPPERIASAVQAWSDYEPTVTSVAVARQLETRDGAALANAWSRAANTLGVGAQRVNRLDDANRLFTQALRADSDNRAAQVNRVVNEALRNKKAPPTDASRPAANVPILQILSADGPIDEPNLLATYGFGLLTAAERLPRQAWDSFYRADQLAPGQIPIQLGLIEAYLQGGQVAPARAALDRLAADPATKTATKEEQMGQQRLEIYYALSQGDLDGAEKRMKDARAQFSTDTSIIGLLTQLYIQQRRFDEAVPLLEQWRKLKPDDSVPVLRLAVIHLSREQFEPALRLLDQALGAQPDNPAARLNRAVCLFRLNRLDDALRDYVALKEKFPDLPMVHFGLAEIALRRGETNNALMSFEHYLKLAPTNTTEYSNVVTRVAGLRGR